MRNFKISIICWIAVLLVSSMSAVWIDNIEVELIQPNGTVINAFASGDNFFRRIHCENDFTMIQDPITGYWDWAQSVAGELISTGNSVHTTSPVSLGLIKGETISKEMYLDLRDEFEFNQDPHAAILPPRGHYPNFVIFVRFPS